MAHFIRTVAGHSCWQCTRILLCLTGETKRRAHTHAHLLDAWALIEVILAGLVRLEQLRANLVDVIL